MLKQEILSFFKGPAGRERRETFKRTFNRSLDALGFPSGAEFNSVVAGALNTALVGVEGWTPMRTLNGGTANAVAAKLDN